MTVRSSIIRQNSYTLSGRIVKDKIRAKIFVFNFLLLNCTDFEALGLCLLLRNAEKNTNKTI